LRDCFSNGQHGTLFRSVCKSIFSLHTRSCEFISLLWNLRHCRDGPCFHCRIYFGYDRYFSIDSKF